MTNQQERTNVLTALADKYNMNSHDRIALFKLYLSAQTPPEGWVIAPVEAHLEQLHAALQEERRFISASTWSLLKEKLASQYRKMIKASPNPHK